MDVARLFKAVYEERREGSPLTPGCLSSSDLWGAVAEEGVSHLLKQQCSPMESGLASFFGRHGSPNDHPKVPTMTKVGFTKIPIYPHLKLSWDPMISMYDGTV